MSEYRTPGSQEAPPTPQELIGKLQRLEALRYARKPALRAEYERLYEEVDEALRREPATQDRPRAFKTKMHQGCFDELVEQLEAYHEIREPEPQPPQDHPLFEAADKWRKAALGSLILISGIPINLVAVLYAHSARDYALQGNLRRAERLLRAAKVLTVVAYLWGLASALLWASSL